jgi:hypothetical protein
MADVYCHFRGIANIGYLHKQKISHASSLTHHVKVYPAMISFINGSTLGTAVIKIIN